MTFSSVQTIRSAISRTRQFFLSGLWSTQLDALPKWKALPVRFLRALTLAVADFFKDDCTLRASSLTFYTLLSIVPVCAVMFGVAKGFGFDKLLEKELMEQLAGQEQALERILAFSRKLLENTQGGLMAGAGVVMMFWAAIKVLGNIEVALNAMWAIKKQRTWWRRFSDYLAVMIFSPILLIVAGGATVFIRTQVSAIAGKFAIAGMMGPLVLQALKLSPLVLICALFTLIYMVMPNTRVPFKPALGGGIIAGILFQIVQVVYIEFQVGVASYNAIYGSFAALPLFFVWVQTSWTLVLFGAKLCYAFQSADTYCSATGCPGLRPHEKKLLALRIARLVIQDFAAGQAPSTVPQISQRLRVPARRVQELVDELRQSGIFTETRIAKGRKPAFQPATDIRRLDVQRVIEALEFAGAPQEEVLLSTADSATIEEALRELDRAAAQSPANRPLKDL
ncbi:MAG: YihY/virulence factor BrkB family protein [Deltaproteobacteria bacterium]|nr:YihY/virulence factor BrkB family protein [Deltaproteobacteria bacterium]